MRATAILGLTLLAGCASAPVSYQRADVHPEQHKSDVRLCTRSAVQSHSIYGAAGHPATPDPRHTAVPNAEQTGYALARTERQAVFQANHFHRCMTDKGYSRPTV